MAAPDPAVARQQVEVAPPAEVSQTQTAAEREQVH